MAQKHLPQWLIDMKTELEISQSKQLKVTERLLNLDKNTKELTIQINHSIQYSLCLILPRNKADHQTNQHYKMLPSDMLAHILKYLTLNGVVMFELTSKLCKQFILECGFWKDIYNNSFSFFESETNQTEEYRDYVLKKTKEICICLQFVKLMKKDRCITKQRFLL